MKTILLPTDFSRASEKALEFGLKISQKTGASILLAHSIFIPAMDINVPSELVQDMYRSEEEESEKKLQQLCEKIKQTKSDEGTPLTCRYISRQNVPVVEIENIAAEKKADLVIMGTEGRDSFWGFLGSTTMEALKCLDCPVLIVKEDSSWNDFKKVFCGVETINEDLFQLRGIIPFLKPFQPEISVLHVDEHAKTSEDLSDILEKKEEAENFIYAFREITGYNNIHYVPILNEDPSEGIADFMEENHPDLLVLLKYKRNWFENLFHRSLIKKIIADTNTPILIIHKKEK